MMQRFNSTIRYKEGYCIDCPPEAGMKLLTAGRCPYHYSLHIKLRSVERGKEKPNNSELLQLDKSTILPDIEIWFSMVAVEIKKNPHCWNCNMWIPDKFYRHASAHIFAKKLFPSIATHPMNFLVLGAACGCHDQSHTLSNFVEMDVWKIAVQRFKIFEPFITEKHKYLNTFREYAEKINVAV